MKGFGWIVILEGVCDDSILLLMNEFNIYVDDYNYLWVDDISHLASTKLLERIKRLKEEYIISQREKNINKIQDTR